MQVTDHKNFPGSDLFVGTHALLGEIALCVSALDSSFYVRR